MMSMMEAMKEKEEVFLCPLSYCCIVYYQIFCIWIDVSLFLYVLLLKVVIKEFFSIL